MINRKGELGVFATVLALVAVCAFSDEALAAGAAGAVSEETDTRIAEPETGTGAVEDTEEAAEASKGVSDDFYGHSGESRPADTDPA